MSLPRNIADYVIDNVALTSQTGTLTSEWFDASDLAGAQFFIEYVGTATVNVTAEVSCVGGPQARIRTRTDYSKVYTVKAGAAATEGFVNPPDPPFDRPFGSYRVIVTTDADITGLKVVVCRNSGQ